MLRKVPLRNGVPRKVPKKALRASISYATSTWARSPERTLFGTFLDTRFRSGTFRSTFSALFLAGASALLYLDGRQDRKCGGCGQHIEHVHEGTAKQLLVQRRHLRLQQAGQNMLNQPKGSPCELCSNCKHELSTQKEP